jgi:hypothetical protein
MLLVIVDKFDPNPIIVNINKLKLHEYLKFITHSLPMSILFDLIN